MYRPYYKCRMCGATYAVGPNTDKDIADLCMAELNVGVVGTVAMAPTLTDTHNCTGEHAGSLGLADFIGWRKQEDAQP